MAPTRNLGHDGFPGTEFTESSKSGNWSKEVNHEDDSDVLIECRNVYKSFGEKHILRGVSFKLDTDKNFGSGSNMVDGWRY
ncbi:protein TRIGALACTOSYLDIACYLGLYCEROL 3, chloroplastic isoform X2 [Gossypium raimondii]|uniref:protein TRIGALACTOSYLDIACYLGLYCEROL 3, chloroplastic isoform X2 n=1 Tax=Gossypium raimondii TaxID=29730 RepID=UPI00227BE75E|nr:protein TRIGALACTOSYLDIACYLGLYCEROL 3, chloroplastic isoform X2 [Gossypium raimondii]